MNKKPISVIKPPRPESVRINRYIASSGICSRRDADELIKKGVVEINGQKVTELGTQVNPGDTVKVNGKMIRNERKVYIVLNKPKDTLTTTDDPEGRRTVLDLVHDATTERIFPVGRLDRNTTGVLLLTNDGDLASKLTHPKYNVKKIYEVRTAQNVTDEMMKALVEGIELEDGFMKMDSVFLIDPASKKDLSVEIHSGKNRIVRRMFEHLGIEIVKLDRVYFAGLTKKTLSRGKWRYMTPKEVGWLKMNK
ncbi:MAG: pseudouridine synthase [Bacteroidales bacterium]|nr:pseudouridine synthase [Bacteroidales bacterium]